MNCQWCDEPRWWERVLRSKCERHMVEYREQERVKREANDALGPDAIRRLTFTTTDKLSERIRVAAESDTLGVGEWVERACRAYLSEGKIYATNEEGKGGDLPW